MTGGHPGHEVTDSVRACWEPHALALLAFERGQRDASMLVIDDLGDTDVLPARWFFRGEEEFPSLERRALDLGRILGSGDRLHLLDTQAEGLQPIDARLGVEVREVRAEEHAIDADAANRAKQRFVEVDGWKLVVSPDPAGDRRELFDLAERIPRHLDHLLTRTGAQLGDARQERVSGDDESRNPHPV